MNSTFLKWTSRDFVKGLIVAILTPVFPIVQQSLDKGTLTFDWHLISVAAVGGFMAYMAKNLFTDDVKAAEKTLAAAKK